MISLYIQIFILLFSIIFFLLLLIKGVRLELLLNKHNKTSKKIISLFPIFLYKNWREKVNISKESKIYFIIQKKITNMLKLFKIFLIFEVFSFLYFIYIY